MLQAVSTRETRDGAREIKYLVTPQLAGEILAWARPKLAADPYAGGASGDEYLTTTLYFDTDDFKVYQRRGSYRRSKYRIRRYGSSDVAFLERKLRTSMLLSKRRTSIPMADLARFDALVGRPDWPGYWFAQRIEMRRLAPVSQVSYHRHAMVGAGPFGPMRLTFDNEITAQPCTHFGFDSPAGVAVLPEATIIEMKYCVKMPALFADLVSTFNLAPAAVSKYRVSLEALRDTGVRTGLRRFDLREALAAAAAVVLPEAPTAGA
jgi:hypothetical protein